MEIFRDLGLLSPVYVPLILSVVLFFSAGKEDHSKVWLGWGMLNAAFLFLANYFYFQKHYEIYTYLHSVHISSVLAAYPFIYTYILKLTSPPGKKVRAWIHFLPSIVFFFLSAPVFYLMLNVQERVQFMSEYRFAPDFSNPLMNYLLVIRFLNIVCLFVQIFLYFILSFRLLNKHRYEAVNWFADYGKIGLKWMWLFNSLFFGMAILSIFFYSVNPVKLFGDDRYLVIPLFLLGLLIWALGVLGFRQKPLFDERDRMAVTLVGRIEPDSAIMSRIKSFFGDQKPWLNNDFKLADLCLELGTNRTYVSQAINRSYGVNFNSFVNQYRVDEAKRLLSLEPGLLLEEVAIRSGFGSAVSMSRAFKQLENLTPGMLRDRLRFVAETERFS